MSNDLYGRMLDDDAMLGGLHYGTPAHVYPVSTDPDRDSDGCTQAYWATLDAGWEGRPYTALMPMDQHREYHASRYIRSGRVPKQSWAEYLKEKNI